MSKAQYEIFVRKTTQLARSLVIKSTAGAEAMNQYLRERGIEVNDNDPTTWRYYHHLAGIYHPQDKPMDVVSLDTLQTIPFTSEVLRLHPTTRRAYMSETSYLKELRDRFPLQEQLIRGVLNPVPMSVTIKAREGQVLAWDETLVEPGETNLIDRISDWCIAYMERWNVRPYGLTDDLYPAAQLMVMCFHLPAAILNIRLANCHTPFVHSFHIREYLTGQGRLDRYVDAMSPYQRLWFYRNIRYIQRNVGRQETFESLIENVLTHRGLPLAAWSMAHNTKDTIAEIYPDVEFRREPLNFGFNRAGVDTRTVAQLLDVEQPLAVGNARVQPEAEITINQRMETSLHDRLRTKVLESAVLDLTDSVPYTQSDALLNHWLWLAFRGRYTAVINVDNPKTGGKYALSTVEAFLVFLYTYNKARGLELPYLPDMEAMFVRRLTTPSFDELRGLAEPSRIPDSRILQAIAAAPTVGSYISVQAFRAGVLTIHSGQLAHRALYASEEEMQARGQMEQVTGRFYGHMPIRFNGTPYTTWFDDRGLDVDTLTDIECDIVSAEILKVATGMDLRDELSLKEIQATLLRLMTQLSSYSVQYLQSINTDPVMVSDWSAVRVGDTTVKGEIFDSVVYVNSEVLDLDARGRVLDPIDIYQIGLSPNLVTDRQYDLVYVPTDLSYEYGARPLYRVRMEISDIALLSIDEPVAVLGDGTPVHLSNEYQL